MSRHSRSISWLQFIDLCEFWPSTTRANHRNPQYKNRFWWKITFTTPIGVQKFPRMSRSAGRSVHPPHDSVATFDRFLDNFFQSRKKNISIIFQPRVTIFYKHKENHKSNRHRSFAPVFSLGVAARGGRGAPQIARNLVLLSKMLVFWQFSL